MPLLNSHHMSGILIIGNGWIGNRLLEKFPETMRMSTEIFDSAKRLSAMLEREEPDAIINCAGVTGKPNVDWCETHQVETAVGNTQFPVMLAQACEDHGVHLTHLGSGCIFYGQPPQPEGWKEDDYANPVAYYSKSKYAADLVLGYMPNVAVVRLKLPLDYVPSPKNNLTKLSKYPKVVEAVNSITVMDDLLDVLREVAEKRAQGIFHAVHPEPLTWRDLMRWYEEIVDPSHTCEFVSEAELLASGSIQKQRSSTILSNTRLAECGIHMRSTEVAVKQTLARYKEALERVAQNQST